MVNNNMRVTIYEVVIHDKVVWTTSSYNDALNCAHYYSHDDNNKRCIEIYKNNIFLEVL